MIECHYCKQTIDRRDLRPYGPRGAMVCHPCATSTPEREAEATRNFAAQLNACGPVAVLDGTEAGPYPIEHLRKPDGSNG